MPRRGGLFVVVVFAFARRARPALAGNLRGARRGDIPPGSISGIQDVGGWYQAPGIIDDEGLRKPAALGLGGGQAWAGGDDVARLPRFTVKRFFFFDWLGAGASLLSSSPLPRMATPIPESRQRRAVSGGI